MKKACLNKVILMDPYPAAGHINAFIDLAQWLSDNGYEIVFIGSVEHRQIFLEEGFRFYALNPQIIVPAAFEIKTKGYFRFLLENIGRSRSKRAMEHYEKISTTYQSVIDLIKPDLILLDDHHGLKAFLYEKLKMNIMMVSTMIVPFKRDGIPPFQSSYVPKHNRISHLYIKYLWALNRTNRGIKNSITGFVCVGNTDIKIIRRIFSNIPYSLDTSRCFGVGIKEIPLIATYPKPFDFKSESPTQPFFYFGQLPNAASGRIQDPV